MGDQTCLVCGRDLAHVPGHWHSPNARVIRMRTERCDIRWREDVGRAIRFTRSGKLHRAGFPLSLIGRPLSEFVAVATGPHGPYEVRTSRTFSCSRDNDDPDSRDRRDAEGALRDLARLLEVDGWCRIEGAETWFDYHFETDLVVEGS